MAGFPSALFVSPHLDDVAFSCSGTLAMLKRRGWRITLATVFTRSIPNPEGFALACQLDKGLGSEVDYMALRRDEDAEFARELQVDALEWLDLLEAPHRGYDSALALFAGVRLDDRIDGEVAHRLARIVDRDQPDWIFAPQGVGNHADHRQVIRALLGRHEWLPRVAWYRDLPYAGKFPEAEASPDLPANLIEVAVPLGRADLLAKFAGSAFYASQVPFQFGGTDAIERILGQFAEGEGIRLGQSSSSEAFRLDPGSLERWDALVRNPA